MVQPPNIILIVKRINKQPHYFRTIYYRWIDKLISCRSTSITTNQRYRRAKLILKILLEIKSIRFLLRESLGTEMLVTSLCWWHYVGDWFEMLVTYTKRHYKTWQNNFNLKITQNWFSKNLILFDLTIILILFRGTLTGKLTLSPGVGCAASSEVSFDF